MATGLQLSTEIVWLCNRIAFSNIDKHSLSPLPSDEHSLQTTINIRYFKRCSINHDINLNRSVNWLRNRKTDRFFYYKVCRIIFGGALPSWISTNDWAPASSGLTSAQPRPLILPSDNNARASAKSPFR